MNVTTRQGFQRLALDVRAWQNEQRLLEMQPLFSCALSLDSAPAQGQRSGKGCRGLAGDSPRASDKNLNTILVEGLKGGRFPAEGCPGDGHGGVR